MINNFSRTHLCFSGSSNDFLATVSLLSNLRKTRVFNFYVANVTVFQIFSLPSHKSLKPLSTQITISFKPHHFQAKSLQNLFKVCISNIIFIFYFRIMQNLCLGFWKLGILENWVGFPIFVKIFSCAWLGLVPFGVCASVLAPCGSSNMYWGIFFHYVHEFSIFVVHCCIQGAWQNVLVTFLCLFWTQVSS